MLSKEELRLIKTIRLVPVFVFIFSIFVIFFITEKNERVFEKNLELIEQKSILEKRSQIKNEISRVFNYLDEERKQTVSLIKKDIKGRTNEAYSIIESIVTKNQGKSPKEIEKLVIDSLREIRFNDGRGYFFLYKTNGQVLMLPTLPHLENKNLWDVQDVKGSYIIRQVSQIATSQGEGFLTWWYNKPTTSDTKKSFEKIGYVKHVEKYSWFVGTGEYIDDFESDLKARLLKHINNISFNKNGYIFVIDKQGKHLSHDRDEQDDFNTLAPLKLSNDTMSESIIKTATPEGDFVSYSGISHSASGLNAQKMSFVRSYKDWGWTIGTGVYLNELNETIRFRREELIKENKQKRYQVILIGLLIFVFVFFLSIMLSNKIRSRFEDYKNKVELKSKELTDLNRHLEETVTVRTKNLEGVIVDLKKTQEKLIETEKMASMIGLVTGVAHEMNTPFGVVITALSQTEENISKFLVLLKEKKLTKKSLIALKIYQNYPMN